MPTSINLFKNGMKMNELSEWEMRVVGFIFLKEE